MEADSSTAWAGSLTSAGSRDDRLLMPISSFCRELLLLHGPLPLDVLADRAVQGGVTRARDPLASVRSALADKEVLLDDGRWATPLWLLEGRILTTSGLPPSDCWPEDEEVMCDELSELSGCTHDLALLDAALRSSALPLVAGGELRRPSYGTAWRTPKQWPGVRPGRQELLGLRIRDRQVHVELVPMTAEVRRAGEQLAHELGPLDPRKQGWWTSTDGQVSQELTAVLWNRMAADPTFLTSPAPPLSRCIPPLTAALRSAGARRAAEARRWRPHPDLPVDAREVAVQAAGCSGQLLDAWLSTFVDRALRELDDGWENGDGAHDEHGGDLGDAIPLHCSWR